MRRCYRNGFSALAAFACLGLGSATVRADPEHGATPHGVDRAPPERTPQVERPQVERPEMDRGVVAPPVDVRATPEVAPVRRTARLKTGSKRSPAPSRRVAPVIAGTGGNGTNPAQPPRIVPTPLRHPEPSTIKPGPAQPPEPPPPPSTTR